MKMKMPRSKLNWYILILLIIVCNLNTVELKRSFGLSRSRPKISSPNIRRKAASDGSSHSSSHSSSYSSSHSGPKASSQHAGAPPAYSQNSHAAKSSPNAPPPPYTPSHAAPPSYSAATGHGTNSFSAPNYPRQSYPSYSGVNSGTSPYHNAPHYGNAGSFGQAPHYGGMPGGAGYPGMASPGFGGNPYGGYAGAMPMGMGMGMGGMPYGYKSSSGTGSLLTPVLTGLAGYQLGKMLSGGQYGHGGQHVYVHHMNPQQTVVPAAGDASQQPISNQQPAAIPNVPLAPYPVNNAENQSAIPNVPLAPFPVSNSENNTTDNASLASAVTPPPEYQAPFPTIHPSLFSYGRQSDSLHYWATSHTKVLNMTPDTTDSTVSSTTASS